MQLTKDPNIFIVESFLTCSDDSYRNYSSLVCIEEPYYDFLWIFSDDPHTTLGIYSTILPEELNSSVG
jgi:hypothetical protein